MNKLWVCSASMLLTAGGALPALAQTGDGLQLEEVVVTAEKREVNLQQVSTSIQVKDGDDLRKTGKKRIDEIMQGTVGIQAQDSQVGVTFFVRGVDSGGMGPGTASSVPVLIDGVAQGRSESVRGGTLDLAQAEIMRGPQSTTLGANALAGAVSLVSNKPVFEYQAKGSLEIGSYHKLATEGVLNVPLSDNQAVRIAYSTDKRNGYISSGAGDSDLTNARIKYRWQPSDDLDFVATASHQNIGGNGVQQGVLLAYGYWQPWANQVALGYFDMGAFNSGAGYCVPQSGITMGCPPLFYATGTGVSFRDRSNPWDDGYPSNTWPNNPYRDTNIDQASVEVNWTTPVGTVTFLPSIQKAHFRSEEPPRGGASFMSENQKQDTTIYDLRLNSPSGQRLTWQAGLYYSRDKLHDALFKNVEAAGDGMGTVCPANTTCYSYDIRNYVTSTNQSAYANAEFSLLDTVRLVGGLRYNNDKAEASVVCPPNPGPGPSCLTITGNAAGPDPSFLVPANNLTYGPGKWKATTYRAGAEWDVTPNTMLYGVYSTGYQPGNLDAMSGTAGPETKLEQISAGFKSQLLDNRLQFNGEFFKTTFHNRGVEGTLNTYINGANSSNCTAPAGAMDAVIVSTGGGGECVLIGQNTATVPEFVSTGVDLDLTWVLSANDRLTFTAEYLKAQYDAAPTVSDMGTPVNLAATIAGLGGSVALQNAVIADLNGYVGNQLQNSPKYSATLDYQHVFNLPGGSKLTPRINGVYKQKYWSFGGAPGAAVSQILADSNNPNNLAWQQAYSKWDVFLGWDSADGRFNVNGYVKNIENEAVLANYTAPYVSLEAPRTYGVTFSASY